MSNTNDVLKLASYLGQYVPVKSIMPLIKSTEMLNEALNIIPTTLDATYVTSIFKHFNDLSDDLCDYWSRSLQQVPHDYITKCFYINEEWIPVKCSNMLIQNGTTGKAVWPASLAFIDDLPVFLTLLKQADRVVEIGCGVGLVGKLLLKSLTNVLLTDTEQVITTTQLNVDPKFTLPLDWNDPSQLRLTDFIIATDVLYDPSNIPSLINIVSPRKCIFVQEVRNPDTWNHFLNALHNNNIPHSVIKHVQKNDHLFYCPNSIVILFINCTL